MAAARAERRTTERLLEELNLAARRDVPAGLLSYAEQRALEIGMTIAGGASVILLDEPTAGMSHSETEYAVALIRRVTQGKTLVMVEHDMRVVFDLADTITVLVYGQVIASGPPAGDPRQPRRAGSLSRGAGGMMLEVRDLHAFYGKSHILQGVDLDGRRGRDRQPARPQRRRPLDHLQGDHGAGASRQGTMRYRGRDIAGLRADLVAHARHRLCAGGPPDLPDADGAAEPRCSA